GAPVATEVWLKTLTDPGWSWLRREAVTGRRRRWSTLTLGGSSTRSSRSTLATSDDAAKTWFWRQCQRTRSGGVSYGWSGPARSRRSALHGPMRWTTTPAWTESYPGPGLPGLNSRPRLSA